MVRKEKVLNALLNKRGLFNKYSKLCLSYGIRADLGCAHLGGADLVGADLRGADLRGAYLGGAHLGGADLVGADLVGADLRGAHLGGAHLGGADLVGADLRGAYLRGADLRGAYLGGADLDKIVSERTIVGDGDITGYKKLVSGTICKILIPSEAGRVGGVVGRKCRAEYAVVVDGAGISQFDSSFFYEIGKTVKPDKWDPNPLVECSHGIHFFITRKEAEEY